MSADLDILGLVIGFPSIQSRKEPKGHVASSCPSGSQGASYLLDVNHGQPALCVATALRRRELGRSPRRAAHSPTNAAVMATLPSIGTASSVDATETKLKTTSSSSRSSPGISRPTFPPIQPDGARPVRRQDKDCRWSEIVSSARPSESTATARIDGSRSVPAVHKRSCKPKGKR